MMKLNRGIILIIAFSAMLIGASCSPARRMSVDDKRRGLLMLEGENVYKNKGFFKEKKIKKRQRQIQRAAKRRSRRR